MKEPTDANLSFLQSLSGLSCFLDVLYRVNESQTIESLAQVFMTYSTPFLPHSRASFAFVEERAGQLHTTQMFFDGFPDTVHQVYLKKFLDKGYDTDPFLIAIGSCTSPTCFRDTDLFPRSTLLKNTLYQQIYLPQDLCWMLRIQLVFEGRTLGQFCFFRTSQEDNFSDSDVSIGALFSKHLALRLSQILHEQEERAANPWSRLGLSEREYEIAIMSRDGKDDSQIAQRLGISISTVRKHIYSCYKKLDVANRAQLFRRLP